MGQVGVIMLVLSGHCGEPAFEAMPLLYQVIATGGKAAGHYLLG
jgi:hypothetical protein